MAKRAWPKPAGYHWDQAERVVLDGGARPCRWCKGPITQKRRRTFCSDPCVERWKCRAYPEWFRQSAYDRDKGICRSCGLDVTMLSHDFLTGQLWLARDEARIGRIPSRRQERHVEPDGTFASVATWLERLNNASAWRVWNNVRGHLFEIDHIKPLVEGGDFFDPENLRLLCVPCHKIETAALAARRKLARKAASN